MEEDSGVKAPVTRLRRRLSVESDDVKSPGPATPTKKRGGRLAAKPQLDLIEENAPTPGSATKRSTRKTSVKEITEAEEKPVTPSRRSTRIKSNTSIVSETTQVYDSPRAKRAAARRTSQVGSDSESSVTPARATRRTRKDSASSVEKLEVTLASKPSNITEVIIEETESSSVKSDDITKSNENTTEITPTRRSPRLRGKKQTEKNQRKSIDKSSVETERLNYSSNKDKLNDSKQNHKAEEVTEISEDLKNENSVSPEKPNVSDTSLLMIKELDKKPGKKSTNLNKSTSALDSVSFQSKRQRTKSWTITTHTQVDEGIFYSDNESVKKKFSKKQSLKESKNESMHMGSGDHVSNNTENEKSIVQSTDEKSEHDTSVQKKIKSESSFSTTKSRISKGFLTPNKSSNTLNSALDDETISPEGNKENIQSTKDEDNQNESIKFFEKAPTTILQSTVFFEDSDTDSKGKGKEIQLDTEDQCVPVVDNKLVEEQVSDTSENGKQSKNNSILNKTNDKNLDNDGCEPMDIDETIPNNTSIAELSQSNLNPTSEDKVPTVQELSVTQSPLINSSLNKSANKSRRKSSITISHNENFEKTDNENKSTLILSQIKDVSSTEHNTSKSPKASNEILSKSACSVNIVRDKALDKKNLSQDYSTSTPLQQKKFQKLGMQINSSIIDTSTTESKKAQNNTKTELTEKSKSSETTSEDDSEDEVDSSRPRNSLLDDEAEDASDDYESGDSQDDEEREYEKENEIIERGETLDSDDEVSNDTDYEKDSFVVSSDEEDNDLLSGSGDDLSMSDNELTMSKKSKKKFNERKLKDQKKASREMYEARHKLDTSDPSLKSRKSKRQKIESTEESSDEETIAPVKRNKLRLDSTQDESLNKSNANDSKLKNKSKRKRLSESVCDENANIEHEITVYGDDAQSNDPLSVQVKLEPKTPMKDMDISTVQINDNIEEICVDNDVSVMKSNETADPLQATMLGEDSSSSISENSDIMNNYDSVLKELNNDKPKSLKSLDMSLNLNKKTKQNKQPIIDQLNITNTKISKKKKAVGSDEVDSAPKSQNKGESSANAFEESSTSDSIDLQLLFSEDSNDFDASQKSFEKKEAQETEEAEDFIPLKRTPGKMNILTTEDNITPTESQPLNESFKNKKRKSKGPVEEQAGNDTANNDIQIIVDTQGTHESVNRSLNISLNTSIKKKNKKNNVTFDENQLSVLNVSTSNKDDEMPEEVPNESTKSKKKNRMSLETNKGDEPPQVTATNKEEDTPEKVKSKKNNRKSSETYLEEKVATNTKDEEDVPEEIPYESSKSKKKNRKSSETQIEEDPSKEEVAEKSMNTSVNVNSAKKKKKKNSESLEEVAETSTNNFNVKSSIKKKKNSESQNEQSSEVAETSMNNISLNVNSAKKKKKNSESQNEQSSEENGVTRVDTKMSMGSAKKQKNKSANNSQIAIEDEGDSAEKSINVSVMTGSAKKNKKKLSITLDNEDIEIRETKAETHNTSTENSKKKKHKLISDNELVEEINVNNVEEISENSKKRKRKSSAHQDGDNVYLEGQNPSKDDSMISGSQKKKRKISQNDDYVQITDANKVNNGSQKKKSKSMSNEEHPEQNRDPEPKKKNKKRKERDDDDGNKTSKIFKENSFDNVHIPRLPTSIINQLDDKPKRGALEMKKLSVVSTTPFVVEDTRKRRNKPSAFLEESVYLNDTHVEKKKKANIKKPKVLPFIPTAVTSGSGFTTNFKINVIPQEVQFVAQSNNVANFKNDYLYGKRIKRLGTYETYKKHRSAKMSKF